MGGRSILTVERLVAGGFGLGRLEGRIVLLPQVLPGEEVLAEVLESKSDYLRAKPLEIINAHPHRQIPVCHLFGVCGGCQLQHLDYRLQPEMKSEAALHNILKESKIVPTIVPSPFFYFYRERVRFQVALIHDRLRLGFFSSGSRRLIPIDFCHQLHPRINAAIPALADWLAGMTAERGNLEMMEVLVGRPGEGLLVRLEISGKPSTGLARIIDRGPEGIDEVRVYYSGTEGRANGLATKSEKGLTWLEIRELGLKLTAWPNVFTQINQVGNHLLVQSALDICRETSPKRVLDLYSGLGNFSQPAAKMAGFVTSVESNAAAVRNAKANMRANGIRNISIRQGETDKAVKQMVEQGERYDLVIMDPPRAGARGLAAWLARLNPADIIYISCHPAALARDLAEFNSFGYGLRQITAFDMFPQTCHIEVMARLSQR
jgi:23S rRNA (uracil1939-C5)-methyltransferase